MSIQALTLVFIGLSFALYLFIAWRTRVRDTQGFYVAGRGVAAPANGMATAADWMSAASFLSMAGVISTMGYAGGVYLMGWTGGFVLLALLLAPSLRKFGRFTVPDFIGDRYESRVARLVAVACAVFVSFTYVAGQMRGVGIVFSRFLEVDVDVGVVIGMALVFVYATLGGMKGITWTQVAQYWVLITAFLVPAIAISIQLTGQPVPQLGMGATLIGEGIPLLAKLDDGDGVVHFGGGQRAEDAGPDRGELFRAGTLGASALGELRARHQEWLDSGGAAGEDGRAALRARGLAGPDPDILVLFPVIALGIFSKRVGTVPAIAGMLVGIGFTAGYILGSVYFGMPRWCFGIGPQGIGTIGMLLNFAVTLGLTPFFPAPSETVQRLVDSIREPEGAGPALAIEAAVDH